VGSAWGDELELAFRLADRADAVSRPQFRSAELLQQHKTDGTPVSQIDLDVEQSMFDLVRAAAPYDHVLGEEIGDHTGTSGRQWIFDGIDGTHNYALGRPGWGTAISCLVDGTVVAGVVSCPAFGRRVWATAGGGAWRAPFVAGVVDGDRATPLHCSTVTDLLAGADNGRELAVIRCGIDRHNGLTGRRATARA
jgi:histidinol-phosphatase